MRLDWEIMRLGWEITGEAKEVAYNNGDGIFVVELFLKGINMGFLRLNLETEEVDNCFRYTGEISEYFLEYFDVAPNFRDYKAFLNGLGIEIPKLSLAHWTPNKYSKVYSIVGNEIIGQVSGDRAEIKKACLSYNVFPTRELAERAENLSKLDRLILLWQYKNDCLFIPDFKNIDQPKHSVIYVQMYKELRAYTIYTVREHKVYFETKEQAEKFVNIYSKEIKKIMGVI